MKTAISLPDELFHAVERLAQRSRRSRSEVYAEALREYVARRDPDEITRAMNEVVAEIAEAQAEDPFLDAAARDLLKNVEW